MGLEWVVNYAVFDETVYESFWSSFDVPAGELAYVYEIENTGGDLVSLGFLSPIGNSFTSIGNDLTIAGDTQARH